MAFAFIENLSGQHDGPLSGACIRPCSGAPFALPIGVHGFAITSAGSKLDGSPNPHGIDHLTAIARTSIFVKALDHVNVRTRDVQGTVKFFFRGAGAESRGSTGHERE